MTPTEYTTLTRYVRGELSADERAEVERRLASSPELREGKRRLEDVIAGLSEPALRLSPGRRRAVEQSFRDAFAASAPALPWFDLGCVFDTAETEAVAGLRGGSFAARTLRFAGEGVTVDVSWQGAPDGEPGVLSGCVSFAESDGTSDPRPDSESDSDSETQPESTAVDGLRVTATAGDEPHRDDVTADGGYFTFDLPASFPLTVTVESPHHDPPIRIVIDR